MADQIVKHIVYVTLKSMCQFEDEKYMLAIRTDIREVRVNLLRDRPTFLTAKILLQLFLYTII